MRVLVRRKGIAEHGRIDFGRELCANGIVIQRCLKYGTKCVQDGEQDDAGNDPKCDENEAKQSAYGSAEEHQG